MDKRETNGNRFVQQKDHALERLSLARASGEVDTGMLPLIDAINALPDLYTTSTCTGRTTLFHDIGGKLESDWISKWHRTVSSTEVTDALADIPSKGIVWFMFEPSIMHVACRTTEDATWLMRAARESGYKKIGIQSIKEDRVMVEICGTERIDAPLSVDGVPIAGDGYVGRLVGLANLKFERGVERLGRFEMRIKSGAAAGI